MPSFEEVFTKKINGIILGDMTRPVVCPDVRYSETHCNGNFLFFSSGYPFPVLNKYTL
jgi:hypothetical protein